jgi:hypothetical protein
VVVSYTVSFGSRCSYYFTKAKSTGFMINPVAPSSLARGAERTGEIVPRSRCRACGVAMKLGRRRFIAAASCAQSEPDRRGESDGRDPTGRAFRRG